MYVLSVQYSCAVVSVFLFGGKANLVLLTLFYSTLLALIDGQINEYTRFAWAGGTFFLLRPKKKSSSHLTGGCAIIIMTGKKKF